MTVHHHATPVQIDSAQWNRLACVGTRYEVLQAWQAGPQPDTNALYTICQDHRYVATATARWLPTADTRRTIDDPVFGRLLPLATRLGLTTGAALLCGPRLGHGAGIRVDPALPGQEQHALVHELCASLESAADAEHSPLIFSGISTRDQRLAHILSERGYLKALNRPMAYLDIRWRDLEGYLATLRTLSKHWKQTARNEINRYNKSGASIRQLSNAALGSGPLFELLYRHHERLNGRPLWLRPEILDALQQQLREDLVIYASVRGEAIDGVVVIIGHGTEAAVPFVGVERASGSNDFAYFNLAYYRPAAELGQRGIRLLWYGNAAYQAKLRRGCSIDRNAIYIRPSSVRRRLIAGPALALQRRWQQRKYEPFMRAAHARRSPR